jgi:2-deoxy-D-gluconate 3-dehydrogenase
MIASKAARMRSIVVPEAENSRDPRFVLADVKLPSLQALTARTARVRPLAGDAIAHAASKKSKHRFILIVILFSCLYAGHRWRYRTPEDQHTEVNMVLNAFDLTGKVAIVTGCDTGLGQGMTLGLAQAGCDIVGINRKIPHDTAAVQALGRRFHAIQADLSQQDDMTVLVDQAVAAMGRVDILVNNAGIIRRHDALTFTESDWDAVIDLNLKAVFLCQAVARQFIRQGEGGKIINIASMLSFQGGIRVPSYTASKSGVLGLTRLLANEWAGQGINVNAIAPGYMATNNTQALREDESATRRSSSVSPPVAGVCRMTCRGRWCFSPRQPPTILTAIRWPSMADGWRAENL